MTVLAIIAGLAAGFLIGLGVGGGGILLMYLTLFAGLPQLQAQGINLLFYIPIGVCATFIHFRKKLIDFKYAIPAIIAGVFTTIAGFYLSLWLGGEWLRKIFAVALLLSGSYELISSNLTTNGNKRLQTTSDQEKNESS